MEDRVMIYLGFCFFKRIVERVMSVNNMINNNK